MSDHDPGRGSVCSYDGRIARVAYEQHDGVAWIQMDDAAANVMGPAMQSELHQALERASSDDLVTVLSGREGVFSGGFDLEVMQSGDIRAIAEMVIGGFELARRILAHPRPVVVECTGHAVAMGLFLLLSGDYLIGPDLPIKLRANEVSIGLTLPHSAAVLLRHRLTPAAYERTAMLSVPIDVGVATQVGALDELAEPSDLHTRTEEVADSLTKLDPSAQQATKAQLRGSVLRELDAALEQDRKNFDDLAAAIA